MALSHITADGGRGETQAAEERNLASVSKTSSHLVMVRQMSQWGKLVDGSYNYKTFVVTPKQTKFTMACAWGRESSASANSVGGTVVLNDTNGLVSQVKSNLDAATWNDGDKALFTYFNRAYDIGYMKYNGLTSSPDYRYMSGHGRSCVAYKFDLRHLHISKLNTFNAYVRAYNPTFLWKERNIVVPTIDQHHAIITVQPNMYNGSGCLRVKFAKELPATSAGIDSDGSETFDFTTEKCNDKRSPASSDVEVYNCPCYDPFDCSNGTEVTYFTMNPIKVYLNDYRTSMRAAQKTYTDFEITGTQQKNFLMNNPGEMWLLATFKSGNGFANSSKGLFLRHCCNCYAQRVELVLKCDGIPFNQHSI